MKMLGADNQGDYRHLECYSLNQNQGPDKGL